MTGDELRKAFLSFFEGKGHTILPSSPLVPHGDPTLLLTTAGMVQIKPYFLGLATPPNPRLASCQKCFRTTDIDSVGDVKHLTFFEMLGNFSVGEYFKKEAIEWAWEFVIRWLRLPSERLWITIFLDDEEAFGHWRRTGVSAERIVRLGEEHNFWGPAGDSGPCGPCSEIHYDFGAEFGCGKSGCGPACDCSRFSEIWNLVFTQYDQDREGHRTPLPRPNIDTGMGLERIAAVMQGKRSVYETDLFAPVIAKVAEISGKRLGRDDGTDRAIKIVAEHVRGITFLIADGVVPSNEGRGYVLRRLLRRTSLFGRKLGLEEAFLGTLVDSVVEKMGHTYLELEANRELIRNVINLEERRFGETLDKGLAILRGSIDYRVRGASSIPDIVNFAAVRTPSPENAAKILEQHGFVGYDPSAGQFEQIGEQMAARSVADLFFQVLRSQEEGSFGEDQAELVALRSWTSSISGREAFELYDTYGFPKELTVEIASERGFSVDLAGFEREMEQQRERARAAHKFNTGVGVESKSYEQLGIPDTRFTGYDRCKHQSLVMGLLAKGKPVDSASAGEDVEVILDETPFYGEMGGQVGDSGEIRSEHGTVSVSQTFRPLPELIVHRGKVTRGRIVVKDDVEAEVDVARRLDIARNHTATHLLQSALRRVLGQHVRQSGSLVNPDGFRFDFTHPEPVGRERLVEIQRLVNENIRQDLPVVAKSTSYGEAVSKGAVALFGEKYGDVVRMVEIGDPPFSIELCGGTHVHATGEIGLLHITSEESIGSGIRRIEAVTGSGAERFLEERTAIVDALARELKSSPDSVQSKMSGVLEDLREERKQRQKLEGKLARDSSRLVTKVLGETEDVGKVYLIQSVDLATEKALREASDRWKEQRASESTSGIVIVASGDENKPIFAVSGTPDVVSLGFHSGHVAIRIGKMAGGGGGGRAELGQGRGKDLATLNEALSQAVSVIKSHRDKDAHGWREGGD